MSPTMRNLNDEKRRGDYLAGLMLLGANCSRGCAGGHVFCKRPKSNGSGKGVHVGMERVDDVYTSYRKNKDSS